MKYKNIIVIAVIVASISFYGGIKYGQSGPSRFGGNRGAEMMNGQFAAGNRPGGSRSGGAGLVNGQILSKTDNSLTVQLRDGGSKLIFFSPATTITRMASGTPTDLLVGKIIMVSGKTNADGSTNAETIQLRSN